MAYRKGICCFYVQVVGKMSDGRNASSSGTAWDVFLPIRKREALCGAPISLMHIDVLLAQHFGCLVMLSLVYSLFFVVQMYRLVNLLCCVKLTLPTLEKYSGVSYFVGV